MKKLERKRLQESYIDALADRQRCAAIFEHVEMDLCRMLKCTRITLQETIDRSRTEGISPLALMKVADYAKAGRELDAANSRYQRAIDDRMAIAFEEACE